MLSHKELRLFTLAIRLTRGIGPIGFQQLLSEYRDIQGVHTYFDTQTKHTLPIDQANQLINQLENLSTKFICYWEEEYPSNLKEIPDPPIVLFYKGEYDPKSLGHSLSVIGTRTQSRYGKSVCEEIVSGLADYGFSIVSGMAFGIDATAHLTALKYNAKTVAVLAGSVDQPSPENNRYIYEEILNAGGLIISETIPGTPLGAGLFPNRNRIVAGISLGTIVIEAGIKSGALITAKLALEYNKEIFAVPGDLTRLTSQGTNTLIKEAKAKLVQNTQDIVVEIRECIEPFNQHNKNQIVQSLTNSELKVYNALLHEPLYIEQIEEILKYQTSKLLSLCSIMEIKGVIIKNEVGQYSIC
jgi:DNA processing protein